MESLDEKSLNIPKIAIRLQYWLKYVYILVLESSYAFIFSSKATL